jgi:predicted nuclease of predicted toxin-antitoxin system
MKFLFDENLPPSFCLILRDLGYEAIHVYDVNLNATPDTAIVEYAQLNDYVILTNDLDFSRIVAVGNLSLPSVITFRLPALNSSLFYQLISPNLADLIEPLQEGSLITIDDKKIRIQTLPVRKN